MKGKLSATVDQPLLEFLDSLPGRTRSEKLERVLRRVRELDRDLELRRELGQAYEDDDERLESEVWERTVSEAMWTE